jgi:hypothetical protein
MIPAHIMELQDVISQLHKAHPKYLKSVPVKETFQGQTVWDGVVEVFNLYGHPKTNRVYAWVHETGDPKHPKHHVTVLHIPPVVSPETAVRAAIAQEFRSLEPKKEN